MLTTFSIQEFRCFRDLTIDSLERVNLIVGKNNVGKTALLEAMWLHYGYFNPKLSLSIDTFRGLEKFKSNELLWDLFNGFDPSKTIKLTSKDKNGRSRILQIQLKEQIQSKVRLNNPRSKRTNSTSKFRRASSEYARMGDSELILSYTNEHGHINRSRLYIDEEKLRVEQARGVDRIESVFMPSRRRERAEEEAERLSKLIKSRNAEKLLKTLQILEDRLEELQILYVAGAPIIHAALLGESNLIPLPLMGDGIGRLLNIALSITYARGGAVFIDEIENGLHFSVMAQIGQAIAELAEAYDVQVFATSHSDECINSIRQGIISSNVKEKSGILLRLERVGADIKAIPFTLDELGVANDHNIEVR